MSGKDKSFEDPAVRNERVPQAFTKISDPSNAHLFTADAARKAFEKLSCPVMTRKNLPKSKNNSTPQFVSCISTKHGVPRRCGVWYLET